MTHGIRPRLIIPRLLAVSTLGLAGCPSGDDGDTGNDTGPSTTSETSTTASTEDEGSTAAASTTMAATETGAVDSTSGGETDTGELPQCQANPDAETCEAVMSCIYLPELGGCIIDCPIIEDETTCMSETGCAWYGDFCDFEPIA